MYTSIIPILGWALTILICGLAWRRGGFPERAGSTLVLMASVIAWIIDTTVSPEWRPTVQLANDGALGIGLLIVTGLYGSLWLGGALLFQAAQFSLHAYYLVFRREQDVLHAVVNNINTAGLILCIMTGVVLAWREAARARNPLARVKLSPPAP